MIMPGMPTILAASVAASFALGVVTGSTWTKRSAQVEIQAMRAAFAEAAAAAERDAREREAKAREEERRRAARIQEVANDAKRKADANARAAAAARRATDELRAAYATVASALVAGGGPADTAAAAGGEAAAGPGLVLAELFGGSRDRLQSCAAALDASRAAGLACERAYDSLTPPPSTKEQ